MEEVAIMGEGFHPRDFKVNHEIREEGFAQIRLEAGQLQPFQSPNRTALPLSRHPSRVVTQPNNGDPLYALMLFR